MPAAEAARPDFAAIKSRQQKTWSSGDYGSVAALVHPVAERLCDSADLQAGWRVLDVAAGTGNATLAAARRGCQAVGIDYVPELLERGRARAAAEGLAVELLEGDAEALPFPDGSFDAVVSVFGVMFAPDQERSARELVRACRPGGRIALANWTPDGFVGELFRVVSRHVPAPAGLRPPPLWGTEARLRELFGAGVRSLDVRPRHFVFRFVSAEALVEFFRVHYGPTLKAFEALNGNAEALRSDLVALARHFDRNRGEGPVAVRSEYVEALAVKA
jgi:SAM-dependent methyltransferase